MKLANEIQIIDDSLEQEAERNKRNELALCNALEIAEKPWKTSEKYRELEIRGSELKFVKKKLQLLGYQVRKWYYDYSTSAEGLLIYNPAHKKTYLSALLTLYSDDRHELL